MILLEVNNRVIYETLKTKFTATKSESVNVTAVDFDGVQYQISNPDNNKDKIVLSAKMPMHSDLQKYDDEYVDYLKKEYGDCLMATPEEGFDVSLEYNLSDMSGDKDEIANKASNLKRNCFAFIFQKYFKIQEAKAEGNYNNDAKEEDTAKVRYHEDEAIYISAKDDRVTVVFSIIFKDPDDIVIGKVFLQEFKDGRKQYQNAPQVLFSYGDKPRELESVDDVLTGENVGYVTFVLFPRHTNDANRENTINLIHQFRTYLHYHIKCSKAYLHQRMRSKTSDFLKVLNRAKPEEKGIGKKA